MIDHAKLQREIRERGFTQKELAERIGVRHTYVSRICNNDSNVKSSTLKAICETLSIDPYDLWKN